MPHSIGALCFQRNVNKKNLFVATGSSIEGISAKGNVFFRFDTNFTESISSMDVNQNRLNCAVGRKIVGFENAQEIGEYDACSEVSALLCLPESKVVCGTRNGSIHLLAVRCATVSFKRTDNDRIFPS